MNNHFFFLYGFRLIQLLAAVGIVFLAMYFDRTNPGNSITRFLCHRDRIWFALMLLLVPAILSHFLFPHLFWQARRGPNGGVEIEAAIFNLFYGAIYGMAGCLFASPARKEDRFGFWIALTVAAVLIILAMGVTLVENSFRISRGNNMPIVLSAVILTVSYLALRASRGKNSAMLQVETAINERDKTEYNPAFAFIWLLVGLLPIPILLVAVSSKPSGPMPPALGVALLIICPVCNLLGGFGCLRGIKNVAVRIILGIFLAAFFFGLSVLVALLQACSHMGGI